jgi:hypothetical protein
MVMMGIQLTGMLSKGHTSQGQVLILKTRESNLHKLSAVALHEYSAVVSNDFHVSL